MTKFRQNVHYWDEKLGLEINLLFETPFFWQN